MYIVTSVTNHNPQWYYLNHGEGEVLTILHENNQFYFAKNSLGKAGYVKIVNVEPFIE